MKVFFKYLFILSSLLICLAYVLDFTVTQAYMRFTPRSKVDWVKILSKKDVLDYVLLGSSRCIQHLNPILINSLTKKFGINLGYAAAKPFEIKLMVSELINHATVLEIYIQIDQSWNVEVPDKLAQVPWLPYLKQPTILKYFQPYENQYWGLMHIPFLRYCLNEPKIGIRNLFFKLIGKKMDNAVFLGYINGKSKFVNKDVKEYRQEIKPYMNPHIADVIELCKNKKIKLFFFTAPLFNNRVNFSHFDNSLENYHDFSDSISKESFFGDPYHLNENGAEMFTQMFVKEYF